MTFIIDREELKSGLIIFRRADVKHRNWYCRVRIPQTSRYKTISLKTADPNDARERAFDHDVDIRFRIKHGVPIFEKSFAEVAKEYLDYQKTVAQSGQITLARWMVIDSYIRRHLNPYLGNTQIALVNSEKWKSYSRWRKNEGKNPNGQPAKDGTIRSEMTVFRAVMNFAADKQYIRERQVPKGNLPSNKARREAFTAREYRALHTFARRWINEAPGAVHRWYRTMTYNFVLVMSNTGMRPMEARNLRWRDIDIRQDRHDRQFVCMHVSGKGKHRELVAAQSVAAYLERIKAISPATEPDHHVFVTCDGRRNGNLYCSPVADLLTKAGLLHSATGSRRSTYCFRHTYATFRLMEGTDVYFLAKQMGTSVKMIEDHYGHITPSENADRILQGVPGWEPGEDNSKAA